MIHYNVFYNFQTSFPRCSYLRLQTTASHSLPATYLRFEDVYKTVLWSPASAGEGGRGRGLARPGVSLRLRHTTLNQEGFTYFFVGTGEGSRRRLWADNSGRIARSPPAAGPLSRTREGVTDTGKAVCRGAAAGRGAGWPRAAGPRCPVPSLATKRTYLRR